MKAKGPNFHEPAPKPDKGSKATDGNTDPGDGARFKGGGLIQLTHRDTYQASGKALHLDLDKNPDLLNTNIDVSAQAMVWFFAAGRTKPFAKVQEALAANDTRTLRESVNGQSPKGRKPAGMAQFLSSFEAGKRYMRASNAFMYLRLRIKHLPPSR